MGIMKSISMNNKKQIERESGEFYSKLLEDNEKIIDVANDIKYNVKFLNSKGIEGGRSAANSVKKRWVKANLIITDRHLIFVNRRADINNLKESDAYLSVNLNLDSTKQDIKKASAHNEFVVKKDIEETKDIKSLIKGTSILERYGAFKNHVTTFGGLNKGLGKLKITVYTLQNLAIIDVNNHNQNLNLIAEKLQKEGKQSEKYQKMIRKTEEAYSNPKYAKMNLKALKPAKLTLLIKKLDKEKENEIYDKLSKIDNTQSINFINDKDAVEKTYMEDRLPPVELRK